MKTKTKKRAYERIPLNMKVIFIQSDTKYSGTVKDISKNGMYIKSDTPLPFNSKLELQLFFKAKLRVYITFNNNVLGVPVRVKRLVKDGDFFMGMGVMILNSSQSYVDFLSNITQAN
jgi:hypothetical protein